MNKNITPALIKSIVVVASICSLIYIFSMLVYPWIHGGGWLYVQGVWARWEPFNAAMLAFISSVLALSISRIKDERQRERNFLAARAFLAESLSDITKHLMSCARTLDSWWTAPAHTLLVYQPYVSTSYKTVFQNCILYAEPRIAGHLSNILSWLQIFDSRMSEFVSKNPSGSLGTLRRVELFEHFLLLGILQAYINKLFSLSRGFNFHDSFISLDDLYTAFFSLKIFPENIYIEDSFISGVALKFEDHIRKAGLLRM